MSDVAGPKISHKRIRTIFSYAAVIFLFTLALLTLSLKIYLLSPYPSRQLSNLLSNYLHQPVTVQTVHATGPNLNLIGLSIADPTGFSGGNLLTVKSLAIKPDYGQLLRGQRVFRLIELDGLQIDLHRNGAGRWNFAGLGQLFVKPAAGETLIRRLSIKNGSFKVNGRAVTEISLTVLDLATKGSKDSRMNLTFRDGARNRYTLEGKGRGGSDAAFDLNLKGASLSLAELSDLAKLKDNGYLKQARGDLQLAASLHKGQLLLHGELGFTQIAAARRIGPVSGRLLFNGSYHQEHDQARLESLDLIVDKFPQLHATGTLSNLKNDRNFELALKIDNLDLQHLPAFLPAEKSRQMTLSGRLGNTELHLAGSGKQGITAITGGARLRELSLAREGRLWISGLSGSVTVQKQTPGILLKGELSSRGSTRAVVESIQAPFTLLLSPKLKLQKALISLSDTRLLGLALDGRARYDLSAAEPFSASLQGSSNDLGAVNPLLKPSGLHINSGKGVATLQAGGSDPLNFKAVLDLQVTGLKGSRGQSPVSLGQGSVSARISRSRGQLAISGNSEFKGMAAAGRSGQARLDYRLADKQLTLENSSITWDISTINLARLTTAIPTAEDRAGAVYYPLAIEISGGDVTHKGSDARGISGRLDGYLVKSGTMRWLEGSATVSGGQLGWQGKPVAGPLALVNFNRSGAKANISGTLLGGSLAGDVAFNPFGMVDGVTLRLAIKGVELPNAAGLLPPRKGATIREGLLDASMAGHYSGKDGLNARIEATGKAVTAVASGRTLISRAGISLSGDIVGQRVTVSKAVATAGDGIRLTAEGTLENAFSDHRQGRFNLAVAQAPCNSFIDAFVNSMPRFVQEATVDGSLAAHGTLTLRNGQRLLQGALLLGKIRLDSPERATHIQDLDGTFPFSLDLSGKSSAAMPKSLDFSRDNFQRLYRQMERPPENSQTVTIGRISLGKMELGALTLHVKAADGLTEIVSMKSSLYEGTVLGTGWLLMKKGGNYRGDLLLSGVSLKELCNRFPKVKGYISGRVNGIVSVYGEGSGISELYGFVDLWANEAKGEKMLVSRDFLQRLGGKKLSGIFFRRDIPYDRAEISALLEKGYLSFDTLDIVHTNIFGVRDLNVSIAPSQNRIALDYLIDSIRQASVSGKAASGQGKTTGEEAPATEFKWEE